MSNQECSEPLCETLSRMKKSAGLTNREIAEMSNIPEATVTKVMNGDTASPNLLTVGGIVKALGGSMDDIMGIPTSEPDTCSETVKAYQMLLESKDQEIKRMEESHAYERARMKRECSIFLALFAGLLAVFIFILVFDLVNGNIGYIRYQASRIPSGLFKGIASLLNDMYHLILRLNL